jgi:hypothetical protein
MVVETGCAARSSFGGSFSHGRDGGRRCVGTVLTGGRPGWQDDPEEQTGMDLTTKSTKKSRLKTEG